MKMRPSAKCLMLIKMYNGHFQRLAMTRAFAVLKIIARLSHEFIVVSYISICSCQSPKNRSGCHGSRKASRRVATSQFWLLGFHMRGGSSKALSIKLVLFASKVGLFPILG